MENDSDLSGSVPENPPDQALEKQVRLSSDLSQSESGGSWLCHELGSDGREDAVSNCAGAERGRQFAHPLHLCGRDFSRR